MVVFPFYTLYAEGNITFSTDAFNELNCSWSSSASGTLAAAYGIGTCGILSLFEDVKLAWYGTSKLTSVRSRGVVVSEELLTLVLGFAWYTQLSKRSTLREKLPLALISPPLPRHYHKATFYLLDFRLHSCPWSVTPLVFLCTTGAKVKHTSCKIFHWI